MQIFPPGGDASPPPKPRFCDICQICRLEQEHHHAFAQLTGVSVEIIEHLCAGVPVHRKDAEQVLKAFGATIQRDLTLDLLAIPLIPTFADLYTRYKFNPTTLAIQAHVWPDVVDKMLTDQPVSKDHAIKVLFALSFRVGAAYTLHNVSVVLEEETHV